MSVNDAKDSSEVNRGESNISVASNIDANFAMRQQNNATISAPENTSMIEHKTTSISDITDPTKRREMDRETRRNARKTRRESRRAERKEKHRLRKLAGALFGGKKKIVWISLAVVSVVCAGYFAVRNYVIIPAWLAKEDAAYEEYKDGYEEEMHSAVHRMAEPIPLYFGNNKEILLDGMRDVIDKYDKNSNIWFMLMCYYANYLAILGDAESGIDTLNNIASEANYLYKKENMYWVYYNIYSLVGDTHMAEYYKKNIKELPRRYINYWGDFND